MLAKVVSGANLGLDAVPVTVEIDIAARGLPAFTIVGLADRAIEESKERVRSALHNSGAELPPKRITINLAPADLHKEGPLFDLPIALGILLGSEQITGDLSDTLVLGELSLDGSLRYSAGVLSMALLARRLGIKRMFVPKDNAKEAAVVTEVAVYSFENLIEVIGFLQGATKKVPEPSTQIDLEILPGSEYDFSQIKGQETAKRALEIAAAGAHNVLLKGSPGAGKTLLARAFPSLLPPLSLEEALEVTRIYSLSGALSADNSIVTIRPFRSPHHTASYVGIIGGGNQIKPGEVSLAHRGVLFLDEFPEFPRQVLEALRQPIEDRQVSISRANGSLTFPSQFILVAAQNPCPCGYYGSTDHACSCLPIQISKYKKKISGPLLDRIDIHLDVPAVDVEKLTGDFNSEDSLTVRDRVTKARIIQTTRFAKEGILTNSEMTNAQTKKYCQLQSDAQGLLKSAITSLHLSARSYTRILKLSRTIADLEMSEIILQHHVAESLQYRPRGE